MMSEIKGYVVRGEKGPHEYTGHNATLSAAMADYVRALRHYDAVRIYAVHADGTETPLPTYEEALAEGGQ
jgi:hypothetical protein